MKKSRGVSTFELSHLVIALAVWTAWAVPAGAVTYTWTNAAAGDWSTPGNWDPSGPPADGSDVVITNGSSVTLSANSFNLSSLTNSGTLTFVNWTTTLSATNVTVLSNGYVTCAGPFTNNAMSNRVYVLCSNLTVFLGGSLNVDAKGYAGGTSLVGAGNGQGPGGGQGAPSYTGGGGYGGRGGRSANVPDSGGASYDSPYTVEAPGSGGGGVESVSGSIGGAGGGAVRIIASGFVTNDGLISAEGQVGLGYGGGGSGGGIYVRCNTIGGSGRFRAGGKDGGPSNNGGGGAGGRVAWVVNPAAQGAQLHNFNFSMSIGRELPDGYLAEPGSLMVSMPQLLPTPLNGMNTYFYGTNDWAFSSLTMSNAWLGFSETNVRVTVSNDITVHGAPVYAGRLDLVSGVMFECRGNLILTNGGQLHVLAGATNASSPDYGALVSVSGAVTVANNCWIYPYSHNVNGATPLFRMSNLVVAAGGGIDANGLGYRGAGASGVGWGPGAGTGSGAACGAGHGGQGGWVPTYGVGGGTYGRPDVPLHPGSGGGYIGGNGGGSIRIETLGDVQLDGLMSANAANSSGSYFGGGAGGSIYVHCRTFTGAGTLSANGSGGGASLSGGGGGGRIAIIYDAVAQAATNNPTGAFSVVGGTAGASPLQSGDIGTLYFPDTRFFGGTMRHVGQLLSPGLTNWSVGNLLLTNSWLRFPQQGFRLTVTNDVVMAGASRLEIGANAYLIGTTYSLYSTSTVASVVSVGGNLSMATGCTAYLYGALTNAATPDYGLLVSVVGDVSLASNATIYSLSQPTNGGSPLLRMSNLAVNAGGSIFASGFGFPAGKGQGAGSSTGGGGGYGGAGTGSGAGGTYGVTNAPTLPGSGGYSAASGGAGGGLVRAEVVNRIRLDGSVVADGNAASASGNGGGSGGGIFLTCRTLTGNNGAFSARGGNSGGSAGGNGGGGRVAVWYGTIRDADRTKLLHGATDVDGALVSSNTVVSSFTGTVAVAGGSGGSAGTGAAGTVVFLTINYPPAGTVILIK